VQTLAVAGP